MYPSIIFSTALNPSKKLANKVFLLRCFVPPLTSTCLLCNGKEEERKRKGREIRRILGEIKEASDSKVYGLSLFYAPPLPPPTTASVSLWHREIQAI